MKRFCYLSLGYLSLTLGVIGIFVPILPTTCFVLLAAFCFSKSSDRLYRLLRSHRVFGPMVVDWEDNRVIRMRAKVMATSLMVIVGSIPLVSGAFVPWKWALLATLILVLAYIWSFPSQPKKTSASVASPERV